MTPDPTLTDEELAAIQLVGPWDSTDLVPRLIAALRASQQREAVLTAKVASERRMYDIAKARADAAEQASADSVEGFAPGWCCPKDYCGVRFVGDEPCPEGW